MKKYFIYIGKNQGDKTMSFDVNVLSSKPIIKAAANMQNDGGGGNLGYMSQGRKEEKDKKEGINIFAQKPEFDTVTINGKLEIKTEEETFDITKWITNIINKLKEILKI